MSTFTQIPYTVEQQEAILKLVQQKGLHLKAGTKGINELWDVLVTELINLSEFIQYRHLFKEGSSRKIRDKYDSILQKVQKDIDQGNQSGKSGDLNKIYSLVKQIKGEIDEAEEQKDAEKNLKKRTNECENEVLPHNSDTHPPVSKKTKPSSGWGKRLDKDGNPISGFDNSRALSASGTPASRTGTPLSFDTALLNFLTENKDEKKDKVCVEEATEEAMKAFVETTGKSIHNVMSEANIRDSDDNETFFKLEAMGIDIMLSIYCTRGDNFSAEKFKAQMAKEEFSTMEGHKLYALMNKWRKGSQICSLSSNIATNSASSSTTTTNTTAAGNKDVEETNNEI